MKKLSITKAFCFIVICLALQSCFSTTITGASAIYNRYTLEQKIADQKIAFDIRNQISASPLFSKSSIDVACFNKQVLLIGQTHSTTARKTVAQIAATTTDVQHVYNFIEIASPISSAQALEDDWITTKIKSTIIAQAKMNPDEIKVVTENGVVYLMGILTHQQAKQVVKIAQYTVGVKRVVKVFKYIEIVDH